MICSSPVTLIKRSDISDIFRAVRSFSPAMAACLRKRAVIPEEINAAARKKAISTTSSGFIMANVCTGTVKKKLKIRTLATAPITPYS